VITLIVLLIDLIQSKHSRLLNYLNKITHFILLKHIYCTFLAFDLSILVWI